MSIKYRPVKSNEVKGIKNLEELLDEEGGLLVEPNPALVFKGRDKNKEKIFVNVTEHELVDEPEEKYMVDLEVGYFKRGRYNLTSRKLRLL